MSKEEEPLIDSQAEPTNESLKRDSQLVEVVGGKDYFLQNLVHVTNRLVERKLIPITLQMGGLLISGLMISGDAYFSELANIYFKDDADSAVQQLIAQCGDIYREGREKSSDMPHGPEYIHLKDCVIISNHTKSKYVTLWRGRLSEVDGFFLGYFSPSLKPPSKTEVNFLKDETTKNPR